jgi:predicted RNase H-like HicB family nuclease
MTTTYIAVAEKDADSAFGIWFPDVAGCFSAGETLAEASANAAVALRQHTQVVEEAGRIVQPARTLDELLSDEDVRTAAAGGAVLIAVSLSEADGINVSLDKNLIDQIDAAAAARGLTRSAFLAQAAREKIEGDAA